MKRDFSSTVAVVDFDDPALTRKYHVDGLRLHVSEHICAFARFSHVTDAGGNPQIVADGDEQPGVFFDPCVE